jgi:hypothetical protein
MAHDPKNPNQGPLEEHPGSLTCRRLGVYCSANSAFDPSSTTLAEISLKVNNASTIEYLEAGMAQSHLVWDNTTSNPDNWICRKGKYLSTLQAPILAIPPKGYL